MASRLKLGLLALLLWATPLVAAQTPSWQISLPQNLGLESFDREVGALWTIQQGILFLAPDEILVYQVRRRNELVKLGPRGTGGGAGNFLLSLKVLSVQGGTILRSMDVPTSGGYSQVLATRGGGFVLWAGSALSSYSPDFVRIAERELAMDKAGEREDWQARVSPSGEKLVLMHEQVFQTAEVLADQTVIHDGKATVDVQVLNATTLRTEKSFALEHTLAFWAPQDDRVISSNPVHSYSDGHMGVLDFSGYWSAMKTEVPKENNACRLGMIALDRHRVALYGCDAVTVLSADGEPLFKHHDPRLAFVSALASGAYLAAQCNHYRLETFGSNGGILAGTHADRIEVYDLDSHKRRMVVPVRSGRAYYAISAQGDLAVVDGASLHLFHVEK